MAAAAVARSGLHTEDTGVNQTVCLRRSRSMRRKRQGHVGDGHERLKAGDVRRSQGRFSGRLVCGQEWGFLLTPFGNHENVLRLNRGEGCITL